MWQSRQNMLGEIVEKYFKTRKHDAISCCKMFFKHFDPPVTCGWYLKSRKVIPTKSLNPKQILMHMTLPHQHIARSRSKLKKGGTFPGFFRNLFSSFIFANMISCCMPLSVVEEDMSWVSKVSNFLFIRVKSCYTVLKLGWILPQDKWRCEEKKCDIC